ncbi:hypothetical protein MTR_7g103290 [Medicago truncatula]|uniref:Uncharacterized protein n=1 Tax=Medicago truncatula TaxID=3880 RepID=A0A072U310_MEDTR|nr:hypothetical protein MTR_7g103290 [Medicago truncatula]
MMQLMLRVQSTKIQRRKEDFKALFFQHRVTTNFQKIENETSSKEAWDILEKGHDVIKAEELKCSLDSHKQRLLERNKEDTST